jgi:hypothetical protein
LVITLGGRKPATPVIFAAIGRCDISLLAGFVSGTKEKEVYAMPRIAHKSCAQAFSNKTFKSEKDS